MFRRTTADATNTAGATTQACRLVDLEVLGCLLNYGRREHDHRGAEIVSFDRAALDRVVRHEPRATWRKAHEASTLYAVLGSDGCVITTGHRWRRVIRDRSLASRRPGCGRRPLDLRFAAQSGCLA